MKFDILKDLCNIYSPSGYENELMKYIIKQTDKLTNFKYLKSNKNSLYLVNKTYNKDKYTIMIDAHIDQIFLKIIGFLESGTVIALPVGFDGYTTDGLLLVHLKSNKVGTVETNPPHLNLERRETNEIYIDFDLSLKEIKKIMKVGDYIVYKSNFEMIGNNSITGTGLDNKLSVFILLELLKKFNNNTQLNKLQYNIVFNFSSREEIGMGSIGTLLSKNLKQIEKIDEIITLDTIFITDSAIIHDAETFSSDILSNEGPVITRNDDDDVCFGDAFILLAEENKIKYQIAYTGSGNGGSNNADYSKYTDSYTQFIGIPLKHMHSPVELVNINDIKNTYELIYKYLTWGNTTKKCIKE